MATNVLSTIPVIDVDSHLTEPADLWTSRLPKRWIDDAPHVEWDEKRSMHRWRIGDTPALGVGQLTTAGWREFFPSFPPTLEDSDPAAFDPHERLKRLDEFGIHAQVLYPNLVAIHTLSFIDLGSELSIACIRAYNDFASEFSSVDHRRLLPIMMLPFWDLEESVREMERCKATGHKGVLFTPFFDRVGLPDIQDPHWSPILEAAQALELPINFHIGFVATLTKEEEASIVNVSLIQDRARMAEFGTAQFLSNANSIARIILGGICHRYPKLNFVSVESGFGYLPFLVQTLDWQFDNFGVHRDHPEWARPSEYFRRQVYGSFWFEQVNEELICQFQDNVMFETDFPHPVSLSPGPASTALPAYKTIERNLSSLPAAVMRKLLHDNAARVYHVD